MPGDDRRDFQALNLNLAGFGPGLLDLGLFLLGLDVLLLESESHGPGHDPVEVESLLQHPHERGGTLAAGFHVQDFGLLAGSDVAGRKRGKVLIVPPEAKGEA